MALLTGEYRNGVVDSNIHTIIKTSLKGSLSLVFMENLDFNDGKYTLANSCILEDDPDNRHYNADIIISLREFPHIHMTLTEIFENVF